MKTHSFAERLKEALEKRDVRQIELSNTINIPKSAISQYLSGNFEPKQDRLYNIALFLNVSEAWLMGFDVPMEREQARSSESDKLIKNIVEILKGCTTEQLEQIYNFVKVMCKKD